ncbi:MAG: peptide ABC transporter substrate-binding protein [Caldilineaceae bacterium]|nr:peptide ABC transporter substrate-binding protein [Caldilineaceae bacterium]
MTTTVALSLTTQVTAPQPALTTDPAQPTPAQAPQSGGTFVQLVARDADTLNPLLTTHPTSRAVLQKIYPVLVDLDPVSGLPTVGRGLATHWQLADAGRTITFTLRDDVRWSDGAPVTAQDVKFTYDLIRDPAVPNAYQDNFANVNTIELSADTPPALLLRLANADCALFQTLNQPILPRHLYQAWTAAQLTDPNLLPQVSAGPFLFIDWLVGHRILLTRNPTYWDGAPRLDGWEFQINPDPLTRFQALAAGTGDWLELTPAQIAQAQGQANLATYAAPSDSIIFVALNLANRAEPQPGRTADGTLNPQQPHLILGDRRMRQALALAIDKAQLLAESYGSAAQPLGSYLPPTIPWAYAADVAPVGYDPAAAARLLDELAWRDSDGDGIRDRAGMPLSLSLWTNSDSEQRVQLGMRLAAQWRAVGIDIRFAARTFTEVTDSLLNQQYDMVLIGWDNLGAEPANSDFWHSRYDAPGSGANFVSYQNAQVDAWLDEARTTPTCDPAVRGKLYRAVQTQIAQDFPYLMLGGQVRHWAYATAWQELQPAPWRFDYNAHRWWR